MTPNSAGVTMGHWHLNSRDVDANRQMFVTMGGSAFKAGELDAVRFPGVIVYLNDAGSEPPAGGSVGSVLDHVCFGVRDIGDSIARWTAAGIAMLPGNNGRTDQAWTATADGLRLEILEDPNQAVPIQHHHLHFFVPDGAIPEIQAWYARFFGAVPGKRAQFEAADLPGANLSFSRAGAPVGTTRGRVLDHVGFDVSDLDAFCKALEAGGIAVGRRGKTDSGARFAFIVDPWGTCIELSERRDQP